MKSKLVITAIAFMAIMVSCQKNTKNESDASLVKSETTSEAGEPAPDQDQQVISQQLVQQTDSIIQPPKLTKSVNIDWDKKIIKTATVRLEVKDYQAFNNLAHKTVRQYGGYVAQEDNDLSEYKSEAFISIKVPVDKFEDLMNGLSTSDTKLIERKITTEDVTGEVVDTKSRLEAKKQMREKYLEFLKQSKNMKEVLEVQGEINGIQEEIEAASGRIGYLSHQAAYSTINLTFYQPLIGYKPDNTTPSFFTRVANAFKGGADWVKNLFVGLIYIWPLILVIIAGIILLRRMRPVKVIHQP